MFYSNVGTLHRIVHDAHIEHVGVSLTRISDGHMDDRRMDNNTHGKVLVFAIGQQNKTNISFPVPISYE